MPITKSIFAYLTYSVFLQMPYWSKCENQFKGYLESEKLNNPVYPNVVYMSVCLSVCQGDFSNPLFMKPTVKLKIMSKVKAKPSYTKSNRTTLN